MATFCFNCAKTVDIGKNVSHAKNRTRRLRKPNLHTAHIAIGGLRKKVALCTKCLRTTSRFFQPTV